MVAKRAYTLSRQLPEYANFARRVRAIFFLATPHRGCDSAETLKRILQAAIGSRQFVDDLTPNSFAIESINQEFPHHCEDLILQSFFETKRMSIGVKKVRIVPKESSILGYRNESTTHMEANHRDVCKFASENDRNYVLLRDSLAKVLEALKNDQVRLSRHEGDDTQKQWLKDNLNISGEFEEDFYDFSASRTRGTCSWIIEKEHFQSWRDGSESQIYWLTARPGTGKSVVSSYVVERLKDSSLSCSYYFFRSDDRLKSSIALLLRTLAWQMALADPRVYSILLGICQKTTQLSSMEYRIVWRKLFVDGIFQAKFLCPQYWIIDAVD